MTAFGQEVAAGLTATPKTLPSSWLYDAIGSSLFETITHLPEYGLTRADLSILQQHGPALMASAGHPRLVLELGSGSGMKTRALLEAARRDGGLSYRPIDVSPTALAICQQQFLDLAGLNCAPITASYLEGLARGLAERPEDASALILFLGSTIGNFPPPDAASFLQAIRQLARPGDTLLLGTDLIKPVPMLLGAYDDPAGVTSAFNRNVLARINRELGGHFHPRQFAHEARWDAAAARIEMHLRALKDQIVRIDALDLEITFRQDETIWTESSHKFTSATALTLGEKAGWSPVLQVSDDAWGFAETLFTVQ